MNHNIDQKIVRSFESEIKDLGNGHMKAIISSESVDRHGERIDMKGLSTKEYMENPIVAAFHDYNRPSVGKTHKLTKTKEGKLIAEFEFAVNINPEARMLYELYKEGFQYAFSIGFIPHDVDGNTYTKSTMLEFSAVLVPANADALLIAKQKGLNLDNIDLTELVGYKHTNGEVEYLMMEINEIRAKSLEDLTLKEIQFLNDNKEDLTVKELKKFADIIDESEETEEVATENNADDISETVEKLVEKKLKELDKAAVKNVGLSATPKAEVSKELKFFHYVKGLQSGDFNDYKAKSSMTTSNTNEVLPPEEFIAEVQRLEEEFGVARRFAELRRGNSGNGIKFVLGDDDVEIFRTSEAGFKQSSKNTYENVLLQWDKFAGIMPISDELTEDSAIDLFQDASRRYARAFARQEDKLVFTNPSNAGVQNYGIAAVPGTNVVTLNSTTFDSITYDNLSLARRGVPTPSGRSGQWYVNHETLGVIERLKDENGQPLLRRDVSADMPMTILGRPVIETEVLPNLTEEDADTVMMIFGDLRYTTLGERTGLNIAISNTAIVGDPDEEDQAANTLNSWTQDLQSMRAVKRMNAVVRHPSAYSVIKTASDS